MAPLEPTQDRTEAAAQAAVALPARSAPVRTAETGRMPTMQERRPPAARARAQRPTLAQAVAVADPQAAQIQVPADLRTTTAQAVPAGPGVYL